jgi:ABC-2 type transport system permease protein
MATEQAKTRKAPRLVIARFVASRSRRGAVLWGLVFGIYVASKSIAYASLSNAARAKVAAPFSNSVGLNVLLGRPDHINTVVGYTSWVCVSVLMIIGAIWAFLLVTKSLRGEETSGRLELLLAGRTSARTATASILAGLGANLLLLYVIAAACFIAVGRYHKVDFDTQSALYFALAAIAGAAEFVAFGAFASQLMPTRSRAASLSAGFFGICFLLKAVADATSAVWVMNITPLGWIEKMQPLQDSRPGWLIPIAGFIAVFVGLSIFLAGRRDLGDSTFADKDSALPKTGLLHSPLGLTVRMSRMSSLSWLLGITLMALFYGFVTKAAAQAFSDFSGKTEKVFSKILQASQQHVGAILYLGVVFLFIMVVMMAYAANAVGAIREDEAEGYLDNLLVRPISRSRWLLGRLVVVVIVLVLAGLLGTLALWGTVASQHVAVSFHTLLLAGLNTIAPALFTLGIGVLAFGILPRLTTFIAYGVIAWSFLIQLVSSGTTFNHWLLDTSVLQHVPLAPAANPNWSAAAILAGLGLLAALIGAACFRRRDLQTA